MATLPKDTELRFPHIMFVEASAGSGKTYLLSLRFVQFLLSERVPHNKLDNMLAITFTNNAAYEMKKRILGWLKKIALSRLDENEEESIKSALQNTDNLKEKSRKIIENILDNYHSFNVSTIDSFMTRLASASALELGLSPDFEILMNKKELVNEAVYIYLDKLDRPEVYTLLETIRKTESDIDFLLVETIKSKVKKMLEEEDYSNIPPVNPVLKMQEIESEIEKLTEEIQKLYEKAKIEKPKSKLYKFEEVVRDVEECNVTGYFGIKGLQKKSPLDREIFEKVGELREKLKIRLSLREMTIAQRIKEIINQRLHARGKIHIGEITEKLHRFLREENIPAIYFSLGNRFYHFMIDEFQDTNPIQWDNLKILIDEGLSKGGSLFIVGDIKQAIYGFRGSDYRIMKNLKNGLQQGISNDFPSVEKENMYLLSLENNYRSGGNIVDYVDYVFKEELAEFAKEKGDPSGFTTYVQKALSDRKEKGYVKTIHALSQDHRKIVMEILKDVKSRGFSYNDIAILTESNNKVVEISGWLTDEGIPVISESGTDIRTRKVIKEIEYLLRFLDSPTDDFSFAMFLAGEIAKKNMGDSMALLKNYRNSRTDSPLYIFFKEKNSLWWNTFFESVFREVGYLTTYDLILRIIEKFKVMQHFPEETSAILKLLDVALSLEEKGKGSVKHLIELLEDKEISEPFQMDTASAKNGVHVMTIHKAKGLEFDVVINVITRTLEFGGHKGFYHHITKEGTVFMHLNNKEAEKSTHLLQTYEKYKLRDGVEKLNKQYVAMTRARWELYNLIQAKGQINKDTGEEELAPIISIEEKELGQKIEKTEKPGEVSHEHPIISPKITFYTTKESQFIWTSDRIEEVRRGDFYHAVLSEIITIEDLNRLSEIIGKYKRLLGFDEAGIEERIEKALKHPELSKYFERTKKREIKTEITFIDSKGHMLRMDRVIVDTDKVIVIDYKTGHSIDKNTYKDQITEYMEILRNIYPNKTVKGIIFNLDTGEYYEYEI